MFDVKVFKINHAGGVDCPSVFRHQHSTTPSDLIQQALYGPLEISINSQVGSLSNSQN